MPTAEPSTDRVARVVQIAAAGLAIAALAAVAVCLRDDGAGIRVGDPVDHSVSAPALPSPDSAGGTGTATPRRRTHRSAGPTPTTPTGPTTAGTAGSTAPARSHTADATEGAGSPVPGTPADARRGTAR
jgi:hypothetical protein